MPVIEILVDGLDHPEGVCWDPGAAVLWAGGEAGQVYRVELEERRAETVARAPGFVLGVAVDGRGRLILCISDQGSLCVFEDGVVRTIRNGLTFPNFPAFAPDGSLYVSDSGAWGASNGRVFRLSADGELEVFTESLKDFPNGCAVTADGRYLWIVESRRPTVNRVDLGTGEVEEVTRLLGGPTNVAFAGPALDRLVCANLGRWHLALVDSGLRGVPLHYPTSWAADA
jgi:gluconolactonase